MTVKDMRSEKQEAVPRQSVADYITRRSAETGKDSLVKNERANQYRTHTCDVLRPDHIGQTVRLAGWVHRKRDHGQLLFIDLRDHYGITQCVFTPNSSAFAAAETVRLESVIALSGPGHRPDRGEHQSNAANRAD